MKTDRYDKRRIQNCFRKSHDNTVLENGVKTAVLTRADNVRTIGGNEIISKYECF